MSLYDGSYLPDSDRKAFPTGHAVLHFVILRPLSGQRLWLLNLHHHQINNTIIKEQQPCKICQHFCQFFGLHILCFSFSLNTLCFTTDLEWLVLSAELLHGCCGVFQFPPQLYYFGLQFLDFTFTLYTPKHNQRTLRNACSNSLGQGHLDRSTQKLEHQHSLVSATWLEPNPLKDIHLFTLDTELPSQAEVRSSNNCRTAQNPVSQDCEAPETWVPVHSFKHTEDHCQTHLLLLLGPF